MTTRCAAWTMVLLLAAAPAAAQQARPSVLAIDSAAAVDVTVDENGNHVTGVFLDSLEHGGSRPRAAGDVQAAGPAA